MQKCSFKSSFDVGRLCDLVYQLYIYEHKQLALEICELTHGVDFNISIGYAGAGFPDIYGLEIRIARELLGENRKNNIPPKFFDYYFHKRVKKKVRYPQIMQRDEISNNKNENSVEFCMFDALYDMIGKGETGLYTELNENWDKIEEAITEYIDFIKAKAEV